MADRDMYESARLKEPVALSIMAAPLERTIEQLRHAYSLCAEANGKQAAKIEDLRAALLAAKEKLEIYRAERSGEYTGGMEYTALIKMIDSALGQG